MDKEKVALIAAFTALGISLLGATIGWRAIEKNRSTAKTANRGLVCLLQRAEEQTNSSPNINEAERKIAKDFYDREIRLAGGRRTDCNIQGL